MHYVMSIKKTVYVSIVANTTSHPIWYIKKDHQTIKKKYKYQTKNIQHATWMEFIDSQTNRVVKGACLKMLWRGLKKAFDSLFKKCASTSPLDGVK